MQDTNESEVRFNPKYPNRTSARYVAGFTESLFSSGIGIPDEDVLDRAVTLAIRAECPARRAGVLFAACVRITGQAHRDNSTGFLLHIFERKLYE